MAGTKSYKGLQELDSGCICISESTLYIGLFFVTLAMKWHLVGILQAQKQKRLPFAAHRSRANLPSLWWKHCVLKQCPKCTRGQKTWATRCKLRTGTHLVQLATEFKRTFCNWKQRDSVNDCCCLQNNVQGPIVSQKSPFPTLSWDLHKQFHCVPFWHLVQVRVRRLLLIDFWFSNVLVFLISVCYLMISNGFLRHGWYKITRMDAGSWQEMHIHVREHRICNDYCFSVQLAMKWHWVGILQALKQKRQPLRLCLYRAPLAYIVSVHVTMQHLALKVGYFFHIHLGPCL